jgi:hypothetical protein
MTLVERSTLDQWLQDRGNAVAAILEAARAPVCAQLSTQMTGSFPSLCFDAGLGYGHSFQQSVFHNTPDRFMSMIITTLRFGSFSEIEYQYKWLWGFLPRYGVQQMHLLATVRMAFATIVTVAPLDSADIQGLKALEEATLDFIERRIR